MDGWIDEWMDGWEGGRMDGWIGGWMDVCMCNIIYVVMETFVSVLHVREHLCQFSRVSPLVYGPIKVSGSQRNSGIVISRLSPQKMAAKRQHVMLHAKDNFHFTLEWSHCAVLRDEDAV